MGNGVDACVVADASATRVPPAIAALCRCVSIIAAGLAFLIVARFFDVKILFAGYLTVLPALILTGMMLGALGMLLSSTIRQLENFAGIMNFVIFPMYFASPALYPLLKAQESSIILHQHCN